MQRFNYPDTSEAVITTRNFASSYLLIDSQDRYLIDRTTNTYLVNPAINPNNILINNQKTLGMGAIKRIALTELSFPFTTPNVNETNNTLWIEGELGDIYYCGVPENFYTQSELATALEDALNNNLIDYQTGQAGDPFGTWSVSVTPKNTFTITTTGTVSFQIINNPNINKQSLMQVMGFNVLENISQIATSYTSGYAPMYYTRYVDIVSNTLTKFQNIKDAQTQQYYSDQVYRLYIDNPLEPSIINKVISNPKFIEWNENQFITSIDIRLLDQWGQPFYIPKPNWNINYFLTMLMSES